MELAGVRIRSAELYGGAASFVMSAVERDYMDLDLMFVVTFNSFRYTFKTFRFLKRLWTTETQVRRMKYTFTLKSCHFFFTLVHTKKHLFF